MVKESLFPKWKQTFTNKPIDEKWLSMVYEILMVGIMVTFDLMELEIRHAASDFCKTLSAFSWSSGLTMVTVGSRIISVIRNLPSTCSSFPADLHSKPVNSNREFSAIAKNVVIRQLATAEVKRCSGDQIFSIPFGNCGGVATSNLCESSGEDISPCRSFFQWISTL